jgi:hypothetical protein
MSLINWSSPYGKNPQNAQKAKSRKKLALADLQDDDEDGESLADFAPKKEVPVEVPAPVQSPLFDTVPEVYDAPKGDMMEKLAYIIRLLEESKDEKTGYVTEEIILYLFLGIFVIFLVDTFVKNGKYSR